VILRLGPNKFAVAVWRGDESGEPVYEIAHEDIRDVSVAATIARAAEAPAQTPDREQGRPG
jgi:hypothetical protein